MGVSSMTRVLIGCEQLENRVAYRPFANWVVFAPSAEPQFSPYWLRWHPWGKVDGFEKRAVSCGFLQILFIRFALELSEITAVLYGEFCLIKCRDGGEWVVSVCVQLGELPDMMSAKFSAFWLPPCRHLDLIYRGARNPWVKRFSACFALKLPPQRGDGEKREGVQIIKPSTPNLWHQN